MHAAAFFIVRLISALSAIAVLFGTTAAGLALWASAQTRPEQSVTQLWFRQKWEVLRLRPWHSLPKAVIRWLIGMRAKLASVTADDFSLPIQGFLLMLFPFPLGAALWLRANKSAAPRLNWMFFGAIAIGAVLYVVSALLSVVRRNRAALPLAISFTLLIGLTATAYRLNSAHAWALFLPVVFSWGLFVGPPSRSLPKVPWYSIVLLFVCTVLLGYALRIWLLLTLEMTLGRAVATALVLLPFYGTAAAFAFFVVADATLLFILDELRDNDKLRKLIRANFLLFGFSVSISFSVTLFAMFIGHLFVPSGPVPQSTRMLISNAMFDGTTVVVTISVLERALRPIKTISVMSAVGVNVMMGGILALMSLWVGVGRLTPGQVLHVLVGHSLDGRRWELGAYFWTMHTVFLPLLVYLSVVTVCWIGKASLGPTRIFFERAQHEDINGLTLTARFFALVAAIAGLGAWILNALT